MTERQSQTTDPTPEVYAACVKLIAACYRIPEDSVTREDALALWRFAQRGALERSCAIEVWEKGTLI